MKADRFQKQRFLVLCLHCTVGLHMDSCEVNMLRFQVRLNIPNGGMVRHTGDVEATVVACKAVKEAVKIKWVEIFTSDPPNRFKI
ncbi:unnamed protein product [Lactuca virosa]|uniref:Uncharacterized protein n=1 Tax=Lactuca virosa TaxID=75947 RepID=A0AAU9M1W1_9ASTR|nr:unnamed protein product [Lactuca virosa]